MALSRLTVATLEDLGYLVNYNGADAYDASDLDASCRCSNRRLGAYTTWPKKKKKKKRLRRTEAQRVSRQKAIEFGQGLLESQQQQQQQSHQDVRSREDLKDVSGDVVAVFYRDPTARVVVHVIVRRTDGPVQYSP